MIIDTQNSKPNNDNSGPMTPSELKVGLMYEEQHDMAIQEAEGHLQVKDITKVLLVVTGGTFCMVQSD
jgi:60kDa lysophospholipase